MTPTRITGKEYPVKDIFCNKFIMKIPNYQRPYAWKTEHCETLLIDLLNAMGDLNDNSDDQEDYFLGSIVVVKDENNPAADVVDGQQRLTTLTILLSVLRSLVTSDDDKSDMTDMIFMRGNKRKKESDSFYLTLRDRDANFFRENIQEDVNLEMIKTINAGGLKSESQKNLVLNTRRLLEMLSGYKQEHLLAIFDYVINNCYLIVVSTPNTASAYKIFQILNDRGLDLSFTDIIKSQLIGALDGVIQDEYTTIWEDAEEQIGREGFKDLFSHIRTISLKLRPRDTVLKELQDHVLKPFMKSPGVFIDDVVIPYKEAYDVIRTSSYQSDSKAEQVNTVLGWLRWIDNYDWIPVAMMAYNKCKDQPDTFLSILNNLERLAASMAIRRCNVNTRQTRYNSVLSWIEENKDTKANDSPLQLTLDEKRDTIAGLEGDVYNSGARGYILRRLNGLMSEDGTTPITNIFTVEHVLPQNPAGNSQWLQWYPDPEKRNFYVHTIGNLALLSKRKNSAASNYDFQTKKIRYFSNPVTPFALTVSIVCENDWTQPVYERRQKQYLSLLKSAWRLDL